MAKIAINTRFLLKDKLEGMGFHIYEILKRIIAANPDVKFELLFDRPWDEIFLFDGGASGHVVYPPARHPILQKWWYDVSIPRKLDRIKPNLFWSPDNFLSLRTSVPTILTVHDLAYLHVTEGVSKSDQAFYARYTPQFIKKAHHILAVSEYTKQDIVGHFDRHAEDITVCYNGCRSYFKPIVSDDITKIRTKYARSRPYFVYLGSQHPRKNVHRLIEAFGRFKSTSASDLQLIIAGRRAWMTEKIDQALDQNLYRDDIIMIDRYLNGLEAAELVGASYCLVYPSLFEGFGIPILEGLYSEVPVITSSTSSMPEVGGYAVAYVDPYSVDSIASAMTRIATDEDYRLSLIEKAKVQKNKFSWDRTANIVWDVLSRYL